jgi:hypothetical protein
MGANTLVDRSDSQVIDETWFDDIRTALTLDFVPRNASGVATSAAGSLGSSTYLWANAYLQGLKLSSNGNLLTLSAPAGLASSISMTLPGSLPGSSLPLLMSSAGAMSTGQITTAQITDSNVTTAKIADSNVTTAKIADSNVTTGKIADGAITPAKMATLTGTVSTSCGSFTTNSSTYVDVTNLSCTLTTTGRGVIIQVVPDGTPGSQYGVTAAAGVQAVMTARILADGSEIADFPFVAKEGGQIPVSSIIALHVPSAGSHTYKVQLKLSTGNDALLYNAKLFVYQL